MSGGPRTELGGIEGLPVAAGAQDKEDGVHADAVRLGRAATAEAMGVLALREKFRDGYPEVVGDAPIIGNRTLIHEDTEKQCAAANSTRAAAL